MKKRLILSTVVAACTLSIALVAGVFSQPLRRVHEVGIDIAGPVTLDVSSGTATNLTGNAALVLDRAFAIEVFNVDGQETIVCSFSSSLSGSTSSADYGREIPPKTSVLWQVRQPKNVLFCLSLGAAGEARATVTKFK